MTPYLKLVKSSTSTLYTLISFFYFLANTFLRTFQSFPTSHKILLVSLYYTIFLLCLTKIIYGSPIKLIQSYLIEKLENDQLSIISFIFTIFFSIVLFSCFSIMGVY